MNAIVRKPGAEVRGVQAGSHPDQMWGLGEKEGGLGEKESSKPLALPAGQQVRHPRCKGGVEKQTSSCPAPGKDDGQIENDSREKRVGDL